ncbi:hypothetical protein Glove_208g132 [Diversispora epigaea]|uniref:Uncharacterized protein n=1 Tax=Diversispora epigaea TaxID=1348612 RepID=A0A397IP20_9GLOM|nr:hypothetical protein Glove_208g132 [Diversispora epigaea]
MAKFENIIEMTKENIREDDKINNINEEDDTIERFKITYNEITNILNSLELFFLQQDEDCNNYKEVVTI